jgi:hypothetical protein
MALENRFRFDELVKSGSRAIVSEDSTSKTHTFIDGSPTQITGSDVPYDHTKGDRDGEITSFIEKPSYKEDQLKKAVDTVIDELVKPTGPPRPDVVPREVYDDLREKYDEALLELAEAITEISRLEGENARLSAELQAALVEVDAIQVTKAIVDNQLQQSTDRYKEVASKLTVAIIKSTKEANERVRLNAQVEGLVAQKDVLRQELLSLRKIVSGLEGQVAAGVESLKVQTEAASAQREAAAQAAEAQRLALENQQKALESQLSGQAAETAAAAAGLEPLSDGESYYGVKADTPSNGYDIGWTTSVDNPKPGKVGSVTIQNLKDSGAKITQVSIRVSGGLSSYGPLGFGSDNGKPKTSQSINIAKGSKTDVKLYMNKKIGGRNQPEPDKSNMFNSAKDYRGNFTISIRYDDGSTASGDSMSFTIRKNKR